MKCFTCRSIPAELDCAPFPFRLIVEKLISSWKSAVTMGSAVTSTFELDSPSPHWQGAVQEEGGNVSRSAVSDSL